MKFGLKEEIIEKINAVFEKYSQIEKVIVYGSRAKGNYKNGSDIDLTMIGKDIDYSTLLKIETQLDDLLLPYKIDLSRFESITNNELIQHINRIGKIFFIK
jgi:predicted nucleotidyltransferase